MIALASDCLLFKMASGESIPFSAEMISVELMGDTASMFDAEFVRHASKAVFHYYKHELGLKAVSVAEFAGALEKVLRGFVLTAKAAAASPIPIRETDLGRLACESGKGCELFFFPRLRDELRFNLSHSPRVLRFRGLRECVKQLLGAQRWTGRCRDLEEQIVDYLRQCLSSERRDLSLVVK
jgi:hypothetical protein